MSEIMTEIKVAMPKGVNAKSIMTYGTLHSTVDAPGITGYEQTSYFQESNIGLQKESLDRGYQRYFSPVTQITHLEFPPKAIVYFDEFKLEVHDNLAALLVKTDLNTMQPLWTVVLKAFPDEEDITPSNASMAIDDRNKLIYVACASGDCLGGNLRKIDFDGNVIWTKDFLGVDTADFSVFAIACDTSGNVYIGTNNNGAQSTAGNFFKVTPEAVVIWNKTIGGGSTHGANYTHNFAMDIISIKSSQQNPHDFGPPFGEMTSSRWDTDGNLLDAFNGKLLAGPPPPEIFIQTETQLLATNKRDMGIAYSYSVPLSAIANSLAYRDSNGLKWATTNYDITSFNRTESFGIDSSGYILSEIRVFDPDNGDVIDLGLPSPGTGISVGGGLGIVKPKLYTEMNILPTASHDNMGSVDSGVFLNPLIQAYVEFSVCAVSYIAGDTACQIGFGFGSQYFDSFPGSVFGAGIGKALFNHDNGFGFDDASFNFADVWQRSSTNYPYPIIPWNVYDSGGSSIVWKAGRVVTFDGNYYSCLADHSQISYFASALPGVSEMWTLTTDPRTQKFDSFPGWGGNGSISSNGKVETYITPQVYTLAIDGLLRTDTDEPFEGMFDVMHFRKTLGANRDNWHFEFDNSAVTRWPISAEWSIFKDKNNTNLTLMLSASSAVSFTTGANFGATMAIYDENNSADKVGYGGTFSMYPGEIHEWSAVKQYLTLAIVALNGSFWLATTDNSGVEPPGGGTWATVTFGT